jgi:threonine synthase
LPVTPDAAISMGEGGTPLIRSRALPALRMKIEFLSPTLSFKDRGAVILAMLGARIGVRRAMVDSSGNAGTAVAAYFGRAGIDCEVLVPGGTSPGKLAQMAAHGATVTVISGSRADAASAAMSIAEGGDVFYASHVYHPYFLHGVKTYGYEIWEQSARRLPAAVLVPVGNGTMLLGCYLAFAELVEAGLADRMPALIGVQAAGCAPIAGEFWGADNRVSSTVAEGIAIPTPPRAKQILAAIRASGGTVVTVEDDDILAARRVLAGEGLFVEATAAVCFAAALFAPDAVGQGWAMVREAVVSGGVVAALCGAGRKDAGG